MKQQDRNSKTHEKDSENRDLKNDIRLHSNRGFRILLAVLGTLSLILGIVGIFLPVLPTTPFLLLTAALYARASEKFYLRLMQNRYIGRYIRNFREDGRIPVRVKYTASFLVLITTGSSSLFFVEAMALKALLGFIGLGVIIYIMSLPHK